MDLRHLRTFVTVVELGTVSRAAVHLRITQPALSRRIADLEKELGLTLFDRVGRRLLLTGAGDQLLESCRDALGSVERISEKAQLFRGGDIGTLKVAASPVQMEAVFSTFLQKFARRYPNVRVRLSEAVGVETSARIERGDIHLGVSLLQSIRTDDGIFGMCEVPPVQLLAAYHPDFRLGRGPTVDLASITAHPLLLLDPGFVVRRTFDMACRHARLKQNILFESGVAANLLAFAEARLGIAVVPSVVRTHRYGLRLARITHKGKPLREPLVIVWDNRRTLPSYVHEFRESLRKHLRGLAAHSERAKLHRKHG